MNATFQRLAPGESDTELLALGASAGSLAWAGAWVAGGLPLPRCAFRAITGCPCPTCGATRCVMALLHGRVSEAFAWNPLVFTGLAAMALLILYSGAVLAADLPRLRLSLSAGEARALRIASIVLVAANWVYEIHHQVG